MPKNFGKIHIYTGNGKGKTTAAIGVAIRAAGHKKQVYLIQFMKGRKYGEIMELAHHPTITITQFGRDEFVSKEHPEQIDIDYATQGLQHAQKIITAGNHDLVILDEINVAIDFKLIPLNTVLELLEQKPPHVELILTGRYASPELAKIADYVSEICEIKHPYTDGVLSRKGIDW